MTAAEWAEALIAQGAAAGEIPLYGSDEWEALPDLDPRRVASVVRAAEVWRRDGEAEHLAAQLRMELAESDLLVRMRMELAELDARSGFVAPTGPSWAELQRRRAELLQVPVDEYGARGWER
ncbi:DUF2742 domain-containing protein [Jiangella aurantiaca]|uniref:DUF2742 domain-containing protein n=1 Tax=Jiangella aurantiaca TaxID=2530373 RepID=A0A4R5A2A2_9ACTN|nr:DUF2742 domain-containing protein [Jiangella aurantiaca]TDD64784.1 DUF2742 domain-containing protein [Jiangella aurantiaca]